MRALLHGVGRDAVTLRLGLVLPSDVFSSHTTFRGSTVHLRMSGPNYAYLYWFLTL